MAEFSGSAEDEEYIANAKTEWGVQFFKPLTIQRLNGGERGIVCPEDIPASSELLSIPFSSLLSTAKLPESPLFPRISQLSLREDDLLCILLLFEKHELQQQSFFYRHIQLLPPVYHSLVNYTDAELKQLDGCNSRSIATIWNTQIESDYSALMAHSDSGQVPFTTLFPWLTVAEYKWGLCTIWSRFVTISRRGITYRCMVPVFDFLNHEAKARASHLYSDAIDSLVLVTMDAIPAGKPVVITYGNKCNEDLLKLYGFAVANNPFNCVRIYAPLNAGVPMYKYKHQLIKEFGLPADGEAPIEVKADGLPADLLKFIRVQRAPTLNELFALRMTGGQRVSSAGVSNQHELDCVSAAEETLLFMLSQYPHDTSKDERQLIEWGMLPGSTTPPRDGSSAPAVAAPAEANSLLVVPSDRYKTAVVVRYSEIKLLRGVVLELQRYKRNLLGLPEV